MPTDRADMANVAMLRSEQRFEARLRGLIEGALPSCSVQLLDLSRGGALAEAAAPPGAGSKVRLRVERLEIEAMVVWAQRTRFGLRFLQPLRATQLLLLLSRSRDAAKNRPSAAPMPTCI